MLFFLLAPNLSKVTTYDWVEEGLKAAAVIIMISCAGGGLGAILKAAKIGTELGNMLTQFSKMDAAMGYKTQTVSLP